MEGFILSVSAGSTLWQHGGMMPVLFLVEGLTVASAAALIAIPDERVSGWLQRALQVLLPVLVVLNLLEIAAVAYAGHPEAQAATALFWSGDLAPLFWGQALAGILLPFVLLTFLGKNRSAVIAASLLIVLGVFVTKLGVLVAGQALTFMQGSSSYTPTWVEAGGVLGIIGLAGLVYALGERLVAQKAS